jgi:hypothetical protein
MVCLIGYSEVHFMSFLSPMYPESSLDAVNGANRSPYQKSHFSAVETLSLRSSVSRNKSSHTAPSKSSLSPPHFFAGSSGTSGLYRICSNDESRIWLAISKAGSTLSLTFQSNWKAQWMA